MTDQQSLKGLPLVLSALAGDDAPKPHVPEAGTGDLPAV